MLLILLVGGAFGCYRVFWDSNRTRSNGNFLFGAHIYATTTATLAACRTRGRWGNFWRGYALFGWVYLVCGLHAGFGNPFALQQNAPIGLALGPLCALAASFLPVPESEAGRPPGEGGG
jgi:hypothetical protein